MIPLLCSTRLRLRAPTIADFETSFAMWSNPDITRYISGTPNTREEVWARLLRYAGHWQLIGYGYWIIETLEHGTYLGEAGFGDFRRDITPNIDAIPEIGWVLAPHAHGQGFATEAATAALAWRDAHLPEGPTSCLISPDNTPSLKLAAKLEFRQISLSSHRNQPTAVLLRKSKAGGAKPPPQTQGNF